MTTVLRLDPSHPPLWRTPTTLQFGLDPVVTLERAHPWQERVVHALERGVSASALTRLAHALGVPEPEVRAFVERVEAALEPAGTDRRGLVRVRACGASDAAANDAVVVGLGDAGLDTVPEDSPTTDAAGRTAAERMAADAAPGPPSPVVLIAHHIVVPAVTADLLRDDVPHLPIVFAGGRVRVGPFVRPGVTACLACDAAHERDADPEWPLLATQLAGRSPAPVPPALAAEAGRVAAHLLRESEPFPVQRSVRLNADSAHREWGSHRPHAGCHCRSPRESARPPATASTRWPTTETVSWRRA